MASSNTGSLYGKNDREIMKHRNGTEGDELFWSLCRPSGDRKKRDCIDCGRFFLSTGHGNRKCAACIQRTARVSKLAAEVRGRV